MPTLMRELLLMADSGPLIALAGVHQLYILPKLYRYAQNVKD